MNDGTEEQLKFCSKILADLHKKSLYQVASHFYEPVGESHFFTETYFLLILSSKDIVKLNIPHYPKMIKKPMDLGTMKKKLDAREYSRADDFLDDFNLMIRNCMTFNPAGTLVHDAGVELQRVFNDKWANLPPLKAPQPDSEDEEEDEDDTDDERNRE